MSITIHRCWTISSQQSNAISVSSIKIGNVNEDRQEGNGRGRSGKNTKVSIKGE